MECSVEGCSAKAVARSWCPKHWWRWRHHGTPDIRTIYDLTIDERFWIKVDRRGPDECWLWLSSARGDGYGAFQLNATKQIAAHRYAYTYGTEKRRAVPNGMVVMHSCDVPLCVNPAHLSLGTNAENCADASRKGRRLPGSKNHQAKLTEEDVLELRAAYAAGGITQADLAMSYDVSPALINHIITRKAWKHI